MRALFIIFVSILFVGCASGVPSVSSRTSAPIFIMTKDANASVFVNFKNSANGEDVNSDIIAEFSKNGFIHTTDIAKADFVVLGDVQSFDRLTRRDFDSRFYMGYGFGRRPFGMFGYSFGFPFDDDFVTSSYFYTMQASVLIRQKDVGDKTTNITLSQGGNTYSKSYIWPYFKQRLAKQIVGFFYNIGQK
ncbi:MAG: complement resistance protein TraT [Campylobacter sp.]|nr:complement resistance protein TraT [Campylobacter sp.]